MGNPVQLRPDARQLAVVVGAHRPAEHHRAGVTVHVNRQSLAGQRIAIIERVTAFPQLAAQRPALASRPASPTAGVAVRVSWLAVLVGRINVHPCRPPIVFKVSAIGNPVPGSARRSGVVALGVVTVRQTLFRNRLSPTETFGHVLAGQFGMHPARSAALGPVNGEETPHLVENASEGASFVAGAGFQCVAMHGIAGHTTCRPSRSTARISGGRAVSILAAPMRLIRVTGQAGRRDSACPAGATRYRGRRSAPV